MTFKLCNMKPKPRKGTSPKLYFGSETVDDVREFYICLEVQVVYDSKRAGLELGYKGAQIVLEVVRIRP